MEKEPYKKIKKSAFLDEKKGEVDGGLEMEASTHKTWIPFDLLFHIFLLLPAESLCRVSFACKTLFNMISSANFIEAHLRQSETVLLTLKSVTEENTSLPFARQPHAQSRKFFFQFWELHSGKSRKVCVPYLKNIDRILASCNGLVLTKMKKNAGLAVINPSTRKHIQLPLGTIGFHPDLYGFMRRQLMGGYKVVHLFRDKFNHIRCEILNLSTRSWHAVDGPSSNFGSIIFHAPVSAIGAIYWLPERSGCNHIVSLGYDDEKFLSIPLPISSTKNDRLIEVGGGLLSFVTHATMHLIQVWILRRDGVGGDNWIKRYSINRNYDITGLIPFCTSGCEMVFNRHRRNLLYVYNLESDEMKEVNLDTETMNRDVEQDDMEFEEEVDNGEEFLFYIPHVNSLISGSTPHHQ
nr:F-box protein At3g07870-like [Ipomoea batatas]